MTAHTRARVSSLDGRLLQLSFFVKRWCTAGTSSFSAAGIDNYAYQTSNFAYAAVFHAPVQGTHAGQLMSSLVDRTHDAA